jgi:hypothetical protein
MMHRTVAASACLLIAVTAAADAPPKFESRQIDPHVGNVCYAVTLADVNGDGKPDIVAVTENAVVWYENPTWQKRTIIENQTERDNVCIAAHDIDGDGQIDFALGAGWQPANTTGGGTIQWLGRGKSLDEKWSVHAISSEPTTHRMRWGDVLRTGRPQLVVSPLQGRGTKGPHWNEGNGVRLLAFSIPADPAKDYWPVEVIDDTLHTMHNHWISDFDGDGYDELLTASWEGVHWFERRGGRRWVRLQFGAGNQDTSPPNKGSSEIKPGRLASGERFIATIEPWHGFQVVVYTEPASPEPGRFWPRHVLDDTIAWGHAVWTADLDGQRGDEIIIGQRDKGKGPIAGPGVFIYRAKDAAGAEWEKLIVDDGGVAVEDLVAGDLNGDGRIDIVAGGRATHNVRLYENRGTQKD